MFAVKVLDPRGNWVTDRKFWDWRDARNHAFYLRLDGYETRIVEVN